MTLECFRCSIDDETNAKAVTRMASVIDLKNKPAVSDPKMRHILDELYSGQGKKGQIGSGSMMDAVRRELKTGKPTGGRYHSKKARLLVDDLKKCISSGRLSKDDKATARALVEELKKSLSGN